MSYFSLYESSELFFHSFSDVLIELLLTILSSVAQQESENTSTHVKLGLKMKKERGELIGFGSCLGYTYNSEENTLTINEDEAKIVRLIYSKYLALFFFNDIIVLL